MYNEIKNDINLKNNELKIIFENKLDNFTGNIESNNKDLKNKITLSSNEIKNIFITK